MNQAFSVGQDAHGEYDAQQQPTSDGGEQTETGQPPVEFASRYSPTAGAGATMNPLLSNVHSVVGDLASRLDRVYQDLAIREQQLAQREAEFRERDGGMARTLADAQMRADALVADAREQQARIIADAREQQARIISEARDQQARIVAEAHEQQAQLVAAAEAEAKRIVEKSHLADQQVAQRLADVGRLEQRLRERDERLAQTAAAQQTERDWLNQYAQTLSSIAADLEKAVGDLGNVESGEAAS